MADLGLGIGAMSSLIPKLAELLNGEYNLQTGLKERIMSLVKELEVEQAALRKVADVPWDELDEQVKLWAREVKESSYDMEDVLDTFFVRVQGRDSGAQKDSLKLLGEKMTDLFKKSKRRREISVGVKDIMAHLDEVTERRRRYKVDDIEARRPATTPMVDPRLAAMYTKVKNLVGIDKSSGELVTMLQGGDVPPNAKIKLVSIVGVGGLGKTTLAKAVYDKLEGDFDYRAFVSVGRNPDLKKVIKAILIELHKERYMMFNFAQLDEIHQFIDELRDLLCTVKRYFIVIDDIWEVVSLERIKLAFDDDDNCGGRIIITTRILEVATKANEVYRLHPLSYDSSRELFYTRIFGDQGSHVYNEQDEILDKILSKCGGLPLAIITVASLLVDTPRDKWFEVYKSIGFGHKESQVENTTMRILSFSYYDLPSHLKPCLLYLSAFPEDSFISKVPLIWKWVAEGFVQAEQGKCLFEIGEGYFNDLINRSMIKAVGSMFDDNIIYGCYVHDMVLDFIRCMSEEENFLSADEGEGHISRHHCRRLAIHNRRAGQSLGDLMYLPRLRSLIAIGCPIYMMVHTISNFQLLRVLDLERCGSMEGYDLEPLGILRHLRYMGLRNTCVRKLPEEIGHLRLLQALELQGSGVEELPASIGNLAGLMCLNTDWTTRLLSEGIKKLTSLQRLLIYPGGGSGSDECSARWFVDGLGNLKELKVLRFLIKAQDEGQLTSLLQSLSNLPKIEALHFGCYGVLELNKSVQLEAAAGFTLSRNLRFLEMCGLELSRLPAWINAQDLPNLCHLSLMLFDVNQEDLEILGQFPELRYLHMLIVNNTKRGGVIIISGCGGFRKLRFCSITSPLQFQQGGMPILEVLDFRVNVRLLIDAANDADCFNFDFGLGHLTSLRQVKVEVNCVAAVPKEIEGAEAALRHAERINHFTLEISHFGQTQADDDDRATNISISSDEEKRVDDPCDTIINKLSMVDNEKADNNKMRILSILRSEGWGKTTLAQKVFDKLSPQFDCAAFVLVGRNPDLREVFACILTSLDIKKYNDFPLTALDLMELIRLVRKSLIHKRFFVVVDDIWDFKAWEIIKFALIENTNRSAVLTTSHDICITTDIGGVEQFARLPITESKKLFYKKLFGSEDRCPPELENMCAELLEKCDGTVSVIDETVTSLASIPQNAKDWQPVYDRRIFDLSYPKLPDPQKKCLFYFGMFCKGYEISGERLVWAWIAEDFVETTEGPSEQTLQDLGKSYLRELVRKRMIETVEVDASGDALSCRAYDFVHDFIISKSTKENFAAILNGSQGRALPDAEVFSRSKLWLDQMKSLIVSRDYLPASHLKGICTLTSLRHLSIGGKCMAAIPTEITKLRNLQTLDLSASGLNELPRSVLSLKKLERLCVSSHMKIPYWITKMLDLQELGEVDITEPELLIKLRALNKLRVLRIAIWSWDESFKTSAKQLCDNLGSLVFSMENIQSLSIATCCSLNFIDGLGDKWAPKSLQKLEIRCSAFDTLPSWFISLSNISSLTIEVYELSQHIIDTLGKLPTLRSLSLTSKEVPKVCFDNISDMFKNLESLKFVSNAMAEMFVGPQSNVMQQLKRLTIVFHASRTKEINKDFSFGLEYLSSSLEHVRVEIICFNASHKMVNDAEAAIWKATISRVQSRNLHLEIRRLEKESMIGDEVDLR